MSNLISDEYKSLNARLHETSSEYGNRNNFLARELPTSIAILRKLFNYESVLDYGCGKGDDMNILEHEGKTYFGAKVGFLQAREKALNFYQKSGWSIIDDPYEIGKIGLHRSMIKRF